MRVTQHQRHKQILFDYSLHNQTLENVQSAKYLGPKIPKTTHLMKTTENHFKSQVYRGIMPSSICFLVVQVYIFIIYDILLQGIC